MLRPASGFVGLRTQGFGLRLPETSGPFTALIGRGLWKKHTVLVLQLSYSSRLGHLVHLVQLLPRNLKPLNPKNP